MNSSRRIHTAGLFLVATAMLAACSDDGDASDGTTAGSSRPPATEPVATTTSTASTSSMSSTTSTSTTQAPATTVDETATTKAAVAAAAVQSRQDYLYAVQNYDAPDALDVLARSAARESPSWALALSNIETLRVNGWRSRPHPSVPSTSTVEGEVELLDGPPSTRAEVTVCTVSSGIVYLPGGAADGTDVIVNDEVVARRNRITMVLEEGAWKVYEGVTLSTWSGAAACPAA